MNTLANVFVVGNFFYQEDKIYFKTLLEYTNIKIDLLLLKNKKENLKIEDLELEFKDNYENIKNKTYKIILKNIIETKDKRFLTIFNKDNYEFLNKDLVLFNLKIKQIENGKYRSSAIIDLYSKEDNFDLSFSIEKNTDYYYIDKILDNLNLENSNYTIGLQEIQFIRNLDNKQYNIDKINELKLFANQKSYVELLNKYSINKMDFLEKAKLLDIFIKNKNKKISSENLEFIKNMFKKYEYKNLPLYINVKIKSSYQNKLLLINFIKNEYEKLKNYFSLYHNNIPFNFLENDIFLNGIIIASNLKNKKNINNLYFTNNNKLLFQNISRFGLTSNILEEFNERGQYYDNYK